jgi:hypothetical protein
VAAWQRQRQRMRSSPSARRRDLRPASAPSRRAASSTPRRFDRDGRRRHAAPPPTRHLRCTRMLLVIAGTPAAFEHAAEARRAASGALPCRKGGPGDPSRPHVPPSARSRSAICPPRLRPSRTATTPRRQGGWRGAADVCCFGMRQQQRQTLGTMHRDLPHASGAAKRRGPHGRAIGPRDARPARDEQRRRRAPSPMARLCYSSRERPYGRSCARLCCSQREHLACQGWPCDEQATQPPGVSCRCCGVA